MVAEADNWAAWERWQAGLTVKPTLCDTLPPLRLLLVMDNLKGHLTASFVVWLFEHGVMPLYTPLSGSWLNMTESIQRILAQRALAGQTPANPRKSSTGWRRPLAPGTPIRHHSNGLANAKPVATEPTDGVIHSADPEPARA